MTAGKSERSTEQRPERVRAFIALGLPHATITMISAWQRRALGEDMRPLDPGGLHITLAFLGDRDRTEIEHAERALLAATADIGAVRIELAPEPVGLPRRRPRVFAFPAESPAAVSLQQALAAELTTVGLGAADGRPYRPHLSVARVRGHPQHRRAGRGMVGDLAPLGGRGGHTFDAVRVALYRSELRSRGAGYSTLADVELPRGSGG